jgi:hypothetical protein
VFAAITDEPPPEVAAAGHDRCIIPIKAENVDARLNPDPRIIDAQYAIFDDRVRPYYEHRMAAQTSSGRAFRNRTFAASQAQLRRDLRLRRHRWRWIARSADHFQDLCVLPDIGSTSFL